MRIIAASLGITGACLLLAAGQVSAAEWKPIGPNGFLDAESIVRSGALVQVWRKVVYKDGVEMPSIVGRKKFETVLVLVEFNCEKRTSRTIDALGFMGPITSGIGLELELSKDVEHVRPESLAEREMKIACASK